MVHDTLEYICCSLARSLFQYEYEIVHLLQSTSRRDIKHHADCFQILNLRQIMIEISVAIHYPPTSFPE